MSEPRISVIIPVYNAEKYLERCVNSVLNQTMQDFELILVNDGSKDASSTICHRFAEADSRIIAVDTENFGPAHARNLGMDMARGKFLNFIDADDSVQPDFLEKLLTAVEMDNADIVMCRARNIFSDNSEYVAQLQLPVGQLFEGRGVWENILPGYFIAGKGEGLASMCNKIYRRAWLTAKGIKISEKRVRAEDWLFNLDCLLACPRFEIIDAVLYNYYQHSGSVMHTLREGEWLNVFESMDFLLAANKQTNNDYQGDIAATTFPSAVEFASRLCEGGRQTDCEDLLRSTKMRHMVNLLPLSKIPKMPRFFAIIAIIFKLHLTSLACKIIGWRAKLSHIN